ncbi:MAG: hypothetical protein VCE74_10605 [Alphaproteobacteria bacterium]|jgi:hypothetical protein
MALPVKLSAVADQLEMVSDFMTVYIHRKTGELAALIEDDISYGDQDDDEDELRQRVEDDDDFIALPDQYEIHEYAIMERFAKSLEDEPARDSLMRALGGRGAFRYFKDRVAELGVRDDWFAFRDQAIRGIAAEFLESEAIPFIDE